MPILKIRCRSVKLSSESRTPPFQRFSYGVGHVLNDIMRQLLFSFRLVFFMEVLRISAADSGWLILQKRLVHLLMSPICAVLVDRIKIPFLSSMLGKRKSWHLFATVLAAISIPLFFSPCFLCRGDGGKWQTLIYLSALNTFLAVSSTLLEIGHLSLMPVIAKYQTEAVELSALRFASHLLYYLFFFICLFIYLFFCILLFWGIEGEDKTALPLRTNKSYCRIILQG